MSTFLGFTIVGLSTAAIYAVIASGLVLTYTTTGVFNFAHGAIGMLAAFAYWHLHVNWGWPTLLSIVVVLGVAAPLLGGALELLMRGVAGGTETAKLVVSVSLLFGMIGIAQAVWSPSVGRTVAEFFTGSRIDLGPTSITYHQLTTITVALVAAVGLRLLLTRTRVGVSMRAVVDDQALSQLNGVHTRRVQQGSWIISVVLAGAGGILVASSAGLNAIVLSMLIVNAYAAAMFGRLRSLPLTFVGAAVVGLADGYLHGYLPTNQYLPGLRLAAPVLLLFVILMVLPNPRLRGARSTREYFPAPTVRGGALFCGLVLGFGLVLATTLSTEGLLTYGKLFPTAIICLSLVPLMGFANQVSLCQLSLAGIGAVTYGHLGQDGSVLGLVVAVALTAVVGALVALPALRLSGIYLALATAAFAVALDRWIFTIPDFHIGNQRIAILGSGSVAVDGLHLGGLRFDSPRGVMVLSTITFVVLAAGVMALRRSWFGRRLVALRDSEAACATFGMNLVAARVGVFALSAAIAGLGGALAGMQAGSVQAQDFEFVSGLPYFMLVAVGGAGFVSAGLTAGVFLQGLFPLLGVVAPWFTKWQALTAGGRIKWIVDGYTLSNEYPYSSRVSLSDATSDSVSSRTIPSGLLPRDQANYVRNSVKAVVDAYDGTVTLYAWDPNDPVLLTWMNAFPGIVEPVSSMSQAVMEHVRYPQDLFKIQRAILSRYHVTDASTFYNGTDVWIVPDDPTVSPAQVFQPPYYLTLQMPGQEKPSFSLTTTFAPQRRQTLAAFMAVDSAPGKDYGKMRVLQLPSNTTIPGPQQVQNNFESDPLVSSQLSLLRAGGSQVELGNLLSLPFNDGLLYVEPVYIRAQQQGYPLFRKVLVGYGSNVAMENTLDVALAKVFGASPDSTADALPDANTPSGQGEGQGTPTPTPSAESDPATALAAALAKASAAYEAGQLALAKGDFAAYGEAQAQLKAALDDAAAAEAQLNPELVPTATPTPEVTPTPDASAA